MKKKTKTKTNAKKRKRKRIRKPKLKQKLKLNYTTRECVECNIHVYIYTTYLKRNYNLYNIEKRLERREKFEHFCKSPIAVRSQINRKA